MMISTWFELDGSVCVSIDDAVVSLSREEAEILFTALGHTLQDQDIHNNKAFDNTPEGEQPEV